MRFAILLAATASALFGQLAPYNSAGVTTGHFHMFVTDPEPLKKIFVDMLGGRVTATGSLELDRFPGAMVAFSANHAPHRLAVPMAPPLIMSVSK